MRKVKRKFRKRFVFSLVLILVVIFTGNFINRIRASEFSNHKRLNILAFGVDAHDKNSSEDKRADTIILISIDSSGKDPVLISIPRDSRVKIPGKRYPDKINHSHAFGGPELLVTTVENLFSIHIDYYIGVNYKSVEEVVDALGGIEVDVPFDMKYNDPYDDPPLYIDLKKGKQVLDGKNALCFLRYRKGYTNQDIGRIEAQQQFINAVMDKLVSPLTVIKLPKLINIFYDNVNTNIPKSKLLSLAWKGYRMKSEEMTKFTLSGRSQMINGIYYYILKNNELQEIRENYLIAEKVEKKYKLSVLNGCGVGGIATRFANILESTGISVDKIGNYINYDVELSFVEYNKQYEQEAKQLKKLLGISQMKEIDGNNQQADIQIIIGKDLVY